MDSYLQYKTTMSPEDYKLARAYVKEYSMDYITAASGENCLYEYDIYNHCAKYYPIVGNLNIYAYLEMFFGALLSLGRQFRFQRDGSRSYFVGIRLRGENGNTTPERKRPVRNYSTRSGSTSLAAEEVVDILYNKGYIKQVAKKKIQVSRLKKLCKALDVSSEFSIVLNKLQDIDGLTLEVILDKKIDKQRQYIVGLTLTEDGKRLIEQAG